MKYFCRVLLILSIFNLPIAMFGNGKPSLTVSFSIKEYRIDFPSEIQMIEKECTKKIIDTLNGYFGFLNFMEDPSPYRLAVSLENKEPFSPSPMREVGFKITLRGSHISDSIKEIYWQFRPKEICHRPLGSAAAFIEEVSVVFKERLHDQPDFLVQRLLSKILITEEALSIRKDLKWVLPFTRKNYEIDFGSQFNIQVEFNYEDYDIQRTYTVEAKGIYKNQNVPSYYLKILTEALLAQKYLEEIKGNVPMNVKSLFIIKYMPYKEKKLKTALLSDIKVEGR